MATGAIKGGRKLIIREGGREDVYVRTQSRAASAEGRYFELVREFPLRPLKDERDLDRATEMMHSLIDKPKLTKEEQDYLEVLGELMEHYEKTHHPIEPLPPREFLRSSIEEKGITQVELARATGISTAVISSILTGRRDMNVDHIKAFADYFKRPAACFLDA